MVLSPPSPCSVACTTSTSATRPPEQPSSPVSSIWPHIGRRARLSVFGEITSRRSKIADDNQTPCQRTALRHQNRLIAEHQPAHASPRLPPFLCGMEFSGGTAVVATIMRAECALAESAAESANVDRQKPAPAKTSAAKNRPKMCPTINTFPLLHGNASRNTNDSQPLATKPTPCTSHQFSNSLQRSKTSICA